MCVPPSKSVCLPPRNGKLLPSRVAPLSLVKTTMVLSRRPSFRVRRGWRPRSCPSPAPWRIDALGFVRHLRVHSRQVRVFRLQRRVDNVKRHVTEERAILVLANEFQDVPRDQVLRIAHVLRAVLAVMPPTGRAASAADSPREVVGPAAVIDPGLVEAVRVDAKSAFEILVRPVFPSLLVGPAKFGRVGSSPLCHLPKTPVR